METTEYQHRLETIAILNQFLQDGGGSFRNLIYDYLDVDYHDAVRVGVIDVCDALNDYISRSAKLQRNGGINEPT